MSEIWMAIPGFSGYEASNQGRVRSYYTRRCAGHRCAISDKPQRILSMRTEKNHRYAAINLVRDDGEKIPMKIHNAVLLAFVGPPPPDMEVRHLDGDSTNNHLDNLCYGTHTTNMREIAIHGRRRLSPEQVIKIRESAANGITASELATEYQVSNSVIRKICHGTTYKAIGGPRVKRMAYPKGVKRPRK